MMEATTRKGVQMFTDSQTQTLAELALDIEADMLTDSEIENAIKGLAMIWKVSRRDIEQMLAS